MSDEKEITPAPETVPEAAAPADQPAASQGDTMPSENDFADLSKKISNGELRVGDIKNLHETHKGFYDFIKMDLEKKLAAVPSLNRGVVDFIIKKLSDNKDSHSMWVGALYYEYVEYKKGTKGARITRNNFESICKDYFLVFKDKDKEDKEDKEYVTIHPCYKEKTFVEDHSLIFANQFGNLFKTGYLSKQQRVSFEVKLKFNNSNRSLPKSLREDRREFKIPVMVTVGKKSNKKVNIQITAGDDKKNVFTLEGNLSAGGHAKRLSFVLNDDKSIQYKIFEPDENGVFSTFTNQNQNSDDYFEETFPEILRYQKIIGRSLFPSKNRNQVIDIGINADEPIQSETKGLLKKILEDNWIVYPWGVQTSSSNPPVSEYREFGRMLSASLWLSILYDINNSSGNGSDRVFSPSLPSVDKFVPARKVDLRPFELEANFADAGLYYDQAALNSLAMALNSGDHVILTGPPGSGKTELAKNLTKMLLTYQGYLLCTASPDWTTNELIGRYMPVADKTSDAVLEFQPGFFIQAIKDGDWLIIDELNRADIDSCMGPLFSVLSGHKVLLPYNIVEAPEKKGKTSVAETPPPPTSWQRVGICLEKDFESLNKIDGVYWYVVPSDFRIICTMNDSDAGMLNKLSYALQRRFSVIRIEAPSFDKVKNYIIHDDSGEVDDRQKKGMVRKIFDEYKDAGRNFPKMLSEDELVGNIAEVLANLFAKGDDDLMQLRVIGFGQIKDIITMAIEGLSCPYDYDYGNSADREGMKNLIRTLIANGVVMKVFPQLPAFAHNHERNNDDTLKRALQRIADVFKGHNYSELSSNNDSKCLDIHTRDLFLCDYLESELRLLFRNQNVVWEDAWQEALK